jgi:hypothetical protein
LTRYYALALWVEVVPENRAWTQSYAGWLETLLGEHMDKDGAEILRILEDCDKYIDALYEAAEWCYKVKKDAIEAELFIQRTKDMWNDLHEAWEV